MLTDRLKEETHKAHIDVEKLVIPKIKSLDSSHSYSRLLKLFYGYFKPVEEKIGAFVSDEIVPDIDERRKSESILRDLQAVSDDDCVLKLCGDIPAISDTAEALGAMYVLEGSTLGGIHLSKMIAERVNIEATDGVEFFSGYGVQTMPKWNEFKEYLNTYTDGQVQNKIIESANETFNKFKKWIEAN